MTCIFYLHGRLGNHFFIISAMMYIMKKYNIKCYLYIPDDILELHCKWTTLGLSYIFDNDNFKDKLIYKLPNNIIYSCDLEYYDNTERLDDFIKDNINTNNTIFFRYDYFQDKKFFLEYKNDIQKIFNIENDYINNYQNIITNNDVFISVRRGDYITANFYVLNEKYYIDNYNKYFAGKNIYMSSDDLIWCRKKLTLDKFNNCKCITYIRESHPLEIVSISKYFSNYICANSTFSWMCSLISINNNAKIITVPTLSKSWYRNNIVNDTNIYYDLNLQENKKYIDAINNAENN